MLCDGMRGVDVDGGDANGDGAGGGDTNGDAAGGGSGMRGALSTPPSSE